MAIEKIKVGGFVSDEISKINANFTDVETNYAKKTELPTKTSELTNDSGFITSAAVPTKTSELTNDSNFVNQTQLNTAVGDIVVPTKTSELTNDSNFVNQTQLTNAVNGITVPTKTSELTNDSNFVTAAAVSNGYVAKEEGKGLSTEDYTSAEKTKLAGLSAPTNKTFVVANWNASGSQHTYTVAADGKTPTLVMRKNGADYCCALVDIKMSGTNIVLTSDEAFDGYIVCV